MSGTHEQFESKIKRRSPSERNFGFVFTAVFLFLGLSPLRHGRPIRLWCLALSAALLLVTLLRPSLLRLPNRAWTGLGLLLGKVVHPIVSGLLFYVIFTPIALVLRWMGKDLLRLRWDSAAKTYWLPREASDDLSNMTNQF